MSYSEIMKVCVTLDWFSPPRCRRYLHPLLIILKNETFQDFCAYIYPYYYVWLIYEKKRIKWPEHLISIREKLYDTYTYKFAWLCTHMVLNYKYIICIRFTDPWFYHIRKINKLIKIGKQKIKISNPIPFFMSAKCDTTLRMQLYTYKIYIHIDVYIYVYRNGAIRVT